MSDIIRSTDERGIATLTINRPGVHNAFDDALIADMTRQLEELDQDEQVRVVVVTGTGESFCAGADLKWMQRTIDFDQERNLEDALQLAELMRTLNGMGKPTIARVNGPAYGGGVGLVACCDIAIAQRGAKFAFTEVKLGLVPAVISPYVLAAIGQRHARRYMLSAELLSAERALDIGLLHEVVDEGALDSAVARHVELLLVAGPNALKACKELIYDVSNENWLSDAMILHTAEVIAALRVSPEGQEGLHSFLQRRKPTWRSRSA